MKKGDFTMKFSITDGKSTIVAHSKSSAKKEIMKLAGSLNKSETINLKDGLTKAELSPYSFSVGNVTVTSEKE